MTTLRLFCWMGAAVLLPGVAGPVFGQGRGSAAARPQAGSADAGTPLHLTHVSLYKNGVGFFEHEATVHADARVALALSSAQLNDVLNTLVAVDLGGGHITGAHYNSATPLDQQLRGLAVNPGQEPTQESLFRVLRGARVEVTGAGGTTVGRLLSMEIRPAENTGDAGESPLPERRAVTVVGDAGAIRTLELNGRVSVRLLDAGLRTEVSTYLKTLAGEQGAGMRRLLLEDRGIGVRPVRVSFLSEVPVWKSTYRVLLPPASGPGSTAKATVQGFSVVDNTTGEDWKDVRLSLIAGTPQSFLQPISQPVFDRRPEVALAGDLQTEPQTHDSGEADVSQELRSPERPPKNMNRMADVGAPPPPGSASADLGSSAGGAPASLFGSPTGMGSGAGMGIGAGSGANMGGGLGSPARLPHAAAAAPEELESALRASTEVRTTTRAFDDFFAYELADPVTIPRNGSALVPTLQTQLPVESVTLWSASQPRPLRALWLTNDSKLTLDRGSFTVVEGGSFAGQGLVDPVHPGERRLLSYATDQAVRVSEEQQPETRRITRVTVNRGVLVATDTEEATSVLHLQDAAPGARTVVVEEARRPGWTLESDAVPAETTPEVYRFRVQVQAHGAQTLTVKQRHVLLQRFRVADTTEDQLTAFLRENHGDPALLQQMQPVFAAQRAAAELDVRLAEIQARKRTLSEDQDRLRKNLGALKGSAEEKALAKRYTAELNQQEDALGALKAEEEGLRAQRAAAGQRLVDEIERLEVQ